MTAPTNASQLVEPRQVAAWLRANGWQIAEARPSDVSTWRKLAAADGDFEVQLPLHSGFRDYPRRMAEVLDTLVVASGKPASWLLEEVRASTVDLLRFRFSGPGLGHGRVPMELGARLIGLTRDVLLAAACSAHEPRLVYRARKPSQAMEFLRRVKLAAPEAGSFVVTVHAPVPPGLHSDLSESEEVPFERRATLMLASGTVAARRAAEQAVLRGDAQPFLEGAAAGISANLCEAIAGLVDEEEVRGVDLGFSWALSRAVPAGTPTLLRVGSDLSAILREGARLLRASGATPDFEVEGAVVQLESHDADCGGVAVVAGQVDGQPRKLRVPMEPSDYALAIRAHEQGQLLRCEGELVRRGRRFQLDRVRHVAVLSDEE